MSDLPQTEREPVAWRYQRKEGWDGIWRYFTRPITDQDFETPSDWIVQPLYAAPTDLEITKAEIMAIGDTVTTLRKMEPNLLRDAVEFGVWSMAGPTNDAEVAEVERWVEEAWQEFQAKTPISKEPVFPSSEASVEAGRCTGICNDGEPCNCGPSMPTVRASGAKPPSEGIGDDLFLPCDVALPNNLFIRKGCKLSTLLHALERRGLKVSAGDGAGVVKP